MLTPLGSCCSVCSLARCGQVDSPGLVQRRDLVTGQVGLVCEPFPVIQHAQHEALRGGATRDLHEEQGGGRRTLNWPDNKISLCGPDRPAEPVEGFIAKDHAHGCASAC